MAKAGRLTRSVHDRVRPAESPANDDHENAALASSNAQIPQLREGLGRRLYSDEIVIGLAGSPRQSPLPALPPDDRDVDVSYVCSSPENTASTLGNVCEIGRGVKGIKGKGSKWKSLGSFFGRREVRSVSPFYHLDPKHQPERDYSETNALRRKRADSNHSKKVHRVDSSTGIPGEESSGLLRRNSSRRRGLRRRKVEELQPDMQRIPAEYAAHAITGNLDPRGEQHGSRMPESPLLQVEIPCVEMERYSVMFGDVLEPQRRQSKPQPSLLARRQAHLGELHTATDSDSKPFDLHLPKPGMREDSISNKSSKSPSFSLFPSTPPLSAHNPVNKLLPKPSPLSRSVTAHSHLILPPRPTIEKSKSHDQDHVLVIVHNSHDIPGTPNFHSRQPDSDPSRRSADSTTAGFFECAEDDEYSYPIIDNPSARTIKSSPHRAFPARKSSMKKRDSPQQRCRQEGNSPVDPAAEVSVARQISISRRQRQLLVPIVPKTARQPMQPRINEQNTTEESRKSHHLTLEDA